MVRVSPRVWLLWGVCAISLSAQWCSTRSLTLDTTRLSDAASWLEGLPRDRTLVVAFPPVHAFGIIDQLQTDHDVTEAVPPRSLERKRYQNIVVLSPAGAPAPEELAEAVLEEVKDWGSLQGRRYSWKAPTTGDGRIIFDLLSDISSTRVTLEGAYGVPCDEPHESGGWQCRGRPPWNYVGPAELTVAGATWPGVWAHPVADHGLVIEVPDIDRGTHIVLEAAFSDAAAATPAGAPVKIMVDVPGVTSRTVTRNNARGPLSLEIPTNIPGAPARGPVTLSLTTPNDGRRHLGLNLRVIDRGEKAQ